MDWESLQKQVKPTGSVEVKKIQLLDSLDDRIVKDLRLSNYSTAEDFFLECWKIYMQQGNNCYVNC